MVEKWQDTLVKTFPPCYGEVDSPVEALFSSAFDACRDRLLVPKKLKITTQKPCGNYRIDFAVACEMGWLAVEIDGHDFHEKTKAQASSDRARERYLVSKGYTLIRFTGSDVWNNPFLCCSETADHIHILTSGMRRGQAMVKANMEAITALFDEPNKRGGSNG